MFSSSLFSSCSLSMSDLGRVTPLKKITKRNVSTADLKFDDDNDGDDDDNGCDDSGKTNDKES